MEQIHLPYLQDSMAYFTAIASLPYAIFLDSSGCYSQGGRYDIMAAKPHRVITSWKEISYLAKENNPAVNECLTKQYDNYVVDHITPQDPFDLVKAQLGHPIQNPTDLPFIGGALGYFSYNLNQRLEKLSAVATDDLYLPLMIIGIYDWCLINDHYKKSTVLIRQHKKTYGTQEWKDLQSLFINPSSFSMTPFKITSRIQSNFNYDTYQKAFKKVKKYLRQGDIYQVNLAQRFHCTMSDAPLTLYAQLRQQTLAPYSGYFKNDTSTILSFSPERFIQVVDQQVMTQPIKGTAPRGKTVTEDEQLAHNLLNSEKNRAENLMIVDLLRNDLSRLCLPGSVKVPHLFKLESFPSVHHLVSTITGTLPKYSHALDLLRACFPGGSITGAPKINAMQMIEALEPHGRAIYCGSLGYISYHGQMDTNICIRTLLYQAPFLYCWAGGGIVMDSKCLAEYEETYHKVNKILAFLLSVPLE